MKNSSDTHLTIRLSWKSVYSIVIALLPLLAIYKNVLNIAEAGTILLLLLSPIVFLYLFKQHQSPCKNESRILVLFLLEATGSVFLWGNYASGAYKTAVLTLLIMVWCLIFHVIYGSYTLFDRNLAIRATVIVAYINSIIIFGQYIAHYIFGSFISLTPTGMLLEHVKQAYSTYLSTGMSHGMFRPAGLFLEPSHMSYYALIPLSYLLLNNSGEKKNYGTAIIITLGLLLSTSGMGAAFALLLWIVSFLFDNKASKEKVLKIILGLVGITVAIAILFQFSFFKAAFDRVFTGDITTSAVYTRIYNMQFLSQLSGGEKWFGVGFLNVPDSYYFYYSGAVKLFYGQGIVGCLLLLLLLIVRFARSSSEGKILSVILIALFFMAEMYSTIYLTYYLMFIFSAPPKHSALMDVPKNNVLLNMN